MGKRVHIHVPGLSHGNTPIPTAVMMGNQLHSSAILGTDIETGEMALPELQTRHAFRNMKAIVETAGGSLDDVVAVRVYMIDYSYREYVNTEWVSMFPDPDNRPTRHAVQMPMFGNMEVHLEINALIGAG